MSGGLFPGLGHWFSVSDADPRLYALYRRHYSFFRARPHRRPGLKCQPFGDYLALLTGDARAGWIWSRPPDGVSQAGQVGVVCALFRNESEVLSSVLVREACEFGWRRWPGQRLYTWVWDAKVRSANPGYCYKRAGWRACGRNKDARLTLLEYLPEWAAAPGG